MLHIEDFIQLGEVDLHARSITREGRMGKVFIIGGRRGLGLAIAQEWRRAYPLDRVKVSSRRPEAQVICDLSSEKSVEDLLLFLDTEKPQRVFCVAGGGPYGEYVSKQWKDHRWALEVCLMAPLRIAHHCLQAPWCEQLVFVGSAIAESSPDRHAASYSSAKHGLIGFLKTVVQESTKDIRLFSPGYMATEMLPPNAAKILGSSVLDPQQVAVAFREWASSPQAAWHKIYTPPAICD